MSDEKKTTPVHLFGKPNYEMLREQVARDIAQIKTWRDKALFYERILQSSQLTLFDPMRVTMEEQDLYRRTILLAACRAFDVEPTDDTDDG